MHVTRSFAKSFQTVTERLQIIFTPLLLLNNCYSNLKIMAASVRVITNEKTNHPLPNQQAYEKSCNK